MYGCVYGLSMGCVYGLCVWLCVWLCLWVVSIHGDASNLFDYLAHLAAHFLRLPKVLYSILTSFCTKITYLEQPW